MSKRPPLFLRGLGFLTISFLIFFLIQPLYLPLGEVLRWHNFLHQPEDSIDVVFLGTSHTYHSFNPEVIDDLLPIHSHAVGIPGDNIQIVYHEIKSILRRQNPQAIFIDAFSLSMTHWLDGPYVYRFLNASFSPPQVMSAVDILFSNGYQWINYFPFRRYQGDRADFIQLMKNPKDTSPPEYPENPKGYARLTSIITDEAYANIPMETYLGPMPEQYLQALEQVIEQSRTHDFKLAFTDTLWKGFENPVYDLYDPTEALTLIRNEDIDYFDFRADPLAYPWTQIHYYDRDHPSEFGALILSVRMAALISEIMDLPVDEAKLAWYQNFYFEEFDLEFDGHQCELALIPANPQAPLNYCYQLLAADETTPLTDPVCSTHSAVSIPVPTPESYWIAVSITQKGGNFELQGRFACIPPKIE
ncbi:MAG: hypothetical protein V2J07_10220 [Anaerolineae bacterium]|jgi:hypothetical protein|nr:hypothetical protein [Anaerolineae bacterium]